MQGIVQRQASMIDVQGFTRDSRLQGNMAIAGNTQVINKPPHIRDFELTQTRSDK